MSLSNEEKQQRRFERQMDLARTLQKSTYISRHVAPDFQRMMRAEWACHDGNVLVMVRGELVTRYQPLGMLICVTCGKEGRWDGGIKSMHCGHYLGGRTESVLFEQSGVAPQDSSCNFYGSARTARDFSEWMVRVRGQDEIDRLVALKNSGKKYTKEQLAWMRLGYMDAIKAAKLKIGEATNQ